MSESLTATRRLRGDRHGGRGRSGRGRGAVAGRARRARAGRRRRRHGGREARGGAGRPRGVRAPRRAFRGRVAGRARRRDRRVRSGERARQQRGDQPPAQVDHQDLGRRVPPGHRRQPSRRVHRHPRGRARDHRGRRRQHRQRVVGERVRRRVGHRRLRVVEVRAARPDPRRVARARPQGRARELDPSRPDRHADAARRACRRAPIRSKPWRASLPAGRVGKVEEVAAMVAFLLSDESSYCYGSEFVLDGGYLAGPLGSPNVK